MIRPEQARRYVFFTTWLVCQMTVNRRVKAAATVAFGAASKLASFGSFIGTFHIIALIVMNRVKNPSSEIPVLSDLTEGFYINSDLEAGILIISVLYAVAIATYVISARLMRSYIDDVSERFVAQLMRRRIERLHNDTNSSGKSYAQHFRRLIRQDVAYYDQRLRRVVNNVKSIAETFITLFVFLIILIYYVPALTGLIIGTVVIFAVVAAPIIYQKEKFAERERQRHRKRVASEQEDTFETFRESLHDNEPDRFVDRFFSVGSRDDMKAADSARKRVDETKNVLQYLLMLSVFALILVYLGTYFDYSYLRDGIDIVYVILVVLVTRFALIHFRQLITQWLNFNSYLPQVQELYYAIET